MATTDLLDTTITTTHLPDSTIPTTSSARGVTSSGVEWRVQTVTGPHSTAAPVVLQGMAEGNACFTLCQG